jgi:DNA-binding transcriptional ArsR family regulator
MVEVTPASVDAMRRAHSELLREVEELRAAIRPPLAPTLAGVGARLGAVRARVVEHFRIEEEGGYMAVVRQRQPRLEGAVYRLAAEHVDLLRALDALIRTAAGDTRFDARFGNEITAWAESLERHEDRENRLIEDAFDLDLGPAD